MTPLRLKILCGPQHARLRPAGLDGVLTAALLAHGISGKVAIHFMGMAKDGSLGNRGIKAYITSNHLILIHVWMVDASKPYLCGIVADKNTNDIFEMLGGITSKHIQRTPLDAERLAILRKNSSVFVADRQRDWEERRGRVLDRAVQLADQNNRTVEGKLLKRAISEIFPHIKSPGGFYNVICRLRAEDRIQLIRRKDNTGDSLYAIL